MVSQALQIICAHMFISLLEKKNCTLRMEVRQERGGDREYVYDVIRKAFEREDEAALVKQLREEGSVFLSMVA